MNGPTGLIGARRLRALLDAHDIVPSKARGQNFVIDPNTIRKVVSIAAPSPDDIVLEIGAGAGALTLALSDRARRVVAVESDRRLIPALQEILEGRDNVEVVVQDALEMDLASTEATSFIANLPYSVAATIVLKVLSEAPRIGYLTVMTQREVGERLAAAPGSRTYGQTSALVGFFGDATVAGAVSRRAFFPVPRVDSVIVRIARHERFASVSHEEVFPIIKAAFGQRRKTVRNTLAALYGSTLEAERVLRAASIDPAARAEALGIEDFVALSKST